MKTKTAGARGLGYLLIVLGAATMVVPFLWILSTSLKSEGEIFSWPPRFVPTVLKLDNYTKIWTVVPLARFFWNTTYVTATLTVGRLFFSSLAGYAFAKHEFPGKQLVFVVLLGTLIVPIHVTIIPTFFILQQLHWLDTYSALIIPGLRDAFGVFLMTQFMRGLPASLIDAARIDGASEFRIFFALVLPMSRPALSTLGIFTFLQVWNDFFYPLIVINSNSMKTLQLGLAMFRDEYYNYWGLSAAGAMISMVPIIAFFLAAQKQFVQGVTLTGMK